MTVNMTVNLETNSFVALIPNKVRYNFEFKI